VYACVFVFGLGERERERERARRERDIDYKKSKSIIYQCEVILSPYHKMLTFLTAMLL
jgi:hypothetical protein